ncbi:MAG: Hsp33 family molecular chaperone HslO [Lachnospiraceae bacterium]|nr:Hsp33 family molecular chaperone HslO [Lachnospiraceae bacterium]
MSDHIVRVTAEGKIRAFACDTTEIAEKARQAHNTSPVVTAALGRLMTAGVMMGIMMKGDADILTIRINGDGPVKGLCVTADSKGHVKGYAEEPCVVIPANSVGKLDVAGAVGKGDLVVIKDLGLKEPYVGQVELISGEIAEDITYYFASSEQTPSSVGLGVLMDKENKVKCAGGFVIQLMPDATDDDIAKIEENLKKFTSVTTEMDNGKTPLEMLQMLLEGFDIEVLDDVPCSFYCNCDKQRVSKALISIGKKELKDMIDDGKEVTLNCHFCNSNYTFTVDELKELYELAR